MSVTRCVYSQGCAGSQAHFVYGVVYMCVCACVCTHMGCSVHTCAPRPACLGTRAPVRGGEGAWCVSESGQRGHWAGPCLVLSPAGPRGGWAAETSVPMETAGFRMPLVPVLVQMSWELGTGSSHGGRSASSTPADPFHHSLCSAHATPLPHADTTPKPAD